MSTESSAAAGGADKRKLPPLSFTVVLNWRSLCCDLAVQGKPLEQTSGALAIGSRESAHAECDRLHPPSVEVFRSFPKAFQAWVARTRMGDWVVLGKGNGGNRARHGKS